MMNLRTQRAILRRLLLVAGILFAITFALWPRPVIYRVEATDFAKKQQDLPGWNSLRQLSLPEYIQEATKDRLLEVEGQPWQDLLQRSRSVTDWLLLTPDQMPWTVEQAAQVRDFTYVRLQEGDLPMVLGITVVRPGDYTPVPAELRYPLRGKSLWILIAVVLGYALIPWSKADKTIVDYRRFRGAILPDLLGLMFLVLFYGLPWLIVPSTSGLSNPLDPDGMVPITIVLWLMALFGVALVWVGAYYEAWSLSIRAEKLELNTLKGQETFSLSDIRSLAEIPYKPFKGLVGLGLLMGLINWRVLGPTLLVASRSDTWIEIHLKNGTSRRFVRTCLRHLDTLLQSCKDAGIEMEVEMENSEYGPKNSEDCV